MNLKAVAEYLQSMDAGQLGVSLFVTEMPLECKEGILLINSYAGTMIDHELPGWRNTGFRMIARGPNYERGEALVDNAASLLTIQRDTQMGSGNYAILMRQALPVNDPLPYRRSNGGVWEFEVDVECVYIKT